jgi:hypothetical protein
LFRAGHLSGPLTSQKTSLILESPR